MASSSLARNLLAMKRHQLLRMAALRNGTAVRCMGGGGVGGDGLPIKVDIGKREVVGFGMNGEENYIDDVHFPFPAIRFKEDNAEITVSSMVMSSVMQYLTRFLP